MAPGPMGDITENRPPLSRWHPDWARRRSRIGPGGRRPDCESDLAFSWPFPETSTTTTFSSSSAICVERRLDLLPLVAQVDRFVRPSRRQEVLAEGVGGKEAVQVGADDSAVAARWRPTGSSSRRTDRACCSPAPSFRRDGFRSRSSGLPRQGSSAITLAQRSSSGPSPSRRSRRPRPSASRAHRLRSPSGSLTRSPEHLVAAAEADDMAASRMVARRGLRSQPFGTESRRGRRWWTSSPG